MAEIVVCKNGSNPIFMSSKSITINGCSYDQYIKYNRKINIYVSCDVAVGCIFFNEWSVEIVNIRILLVESNNIFIELNED